MNQKIIDMPEIGIVETRNLIRAIQQKYDYDFSHYTLTSFRFALDRSILRHHLRYPELLTTRILEEDDFFDEFLFDINDYSVELFRDPETWHLLKSTILPEFFETFAKPKIWIPGACNAQDFYSLLILLKCEYPNKNTSIFISSISEKNLSTFEKGIILAKQVESGLENFEKVFPKEDIYSLLRPNGKDFFIDYPQSQGIIYQKQNLLGEPFPESTDMIFFRNNLIKYNTEYQMTVLDGLTSTLQVNGYLLTGIKENIDEYIAIRHNLKLIFKSEKVYKKTK
jgi:chemotaxis protein methyltransferase CheR